MSSNPPRLRDPNHPVVFWADAGGRCYPTSYLGCTTAQSTWAHQSSHMGLSQLSVIAEHSAYNDMAQRPQKYAGLSHDVFALQSAGTASPDQQAILVQQRMKPWRPAALLEPYAQPAAPSLLILVLRLPRSHDSALR
eukprot:CAMPEP_0181216756 /NCGR_PEP_ID=MMETSP1096-20121128/26768_1 /TAXON_ID=156174 ORGANISM="Chrysochromulina ericina, Strain CCMP281" /NCGR_SAMPLE_ID=MMETSP1096 /ASSEMBLY_ACC=CAM_ASM_000453 /LENGTH=136 /DNA_ID=CAMNT_0023308803 /DNA_START=15 /DNA_END=424 /DNA_ORIENTATION=-